MAKLFHSIDFSPSLITTSFLPSNSHWLCYRRNHITLSLSLHLPTSLFLAPNSKNPLDHFRATLSNHTSTDGADVSLVQLTTSRSLKSGTTVKPLLLPLPPRDPESDLVEVVGEFSRVQFRY